MPPHLLQRRLVELLRRSLIEVERQDLWSRFALNRDLLLRFDSRVRVRNGEFYWLRRQLLVVLDRSDAFNFVIVDNREGEVTVVYLVVAYARLLLLGLVEANQLVDQVSLLLNVACLVAQILVNFSMLLLLFLLAS